LDIYQQQQQPGNNNTQPQQMQQQQQTPPSISFANQQQQLSLISPHQQQGCFVREDSIFEALTPDLVLYGYITYFPLISFYALESLYLCYIYRNCKAAETVEIESNKQDQLAPSNAELDLSLVQSRWPLPSRTKQRIERRRTKSTVLPQTIPEESALILHPKCSVVVGPSLHRFRSRLRDAHTEAPFLVPFPYTPPPILSPWRPGTGLFSSINHDIRSSTLTKQSAGNFIASDNSYII
jgi:hypothetical protein